MKKVINEISACVVCKNFLPCAPRPVFSVGSGSRVLIIGQAPGLKVQNSGTPWDDLSGNELRRWLGVDKEQFYNTKLFGLMPMGFCYPGKGAAGDLPPRPECAPLWHQRLLDKMKAVQLILLIGQYSQRFYLKDDSKPTVTENVKNYRAFLPKYLPLVHPSPRNKIWQKKNPWFEKEVIPYLQTVIRKLTAENPTAWRRLTAKTNSIVCSA